MNLKKFLKQNLAELFIIGIPIFLGFNLLLFVLSLVCVFFYFSFINKPYLFYLLVFVYKYGTLNLITVNVDFLNLLSISFGIYYSLKFFFDLNEKKSNNWTFAFLSIYLILSSFFFSLLPLVSIYKSFGFIVYFSSLNYLCNRYSAELFHFLFILSFFLVITSVLLPSSITNYTELNLHAGILKHSQAFGFLLTLLVPVQLIFYKKWINYKWILGLLLIAVYLIFVSKMRSAYLVIVVLIILIYFSSFFKTIKIGMTLILVVSVIGLFSMGGEILNDIFNKRNEHYDNKITATDEMYGSRYRLIAPSMINFERYPIFGIGFGIPTEITEKDFDIKERWGVKYFPGTNILISLPTEKGVVYTAILEETGIIGCIFFLLFFMSFFRQLSFEKLLLILPVFLLSLGEASILSPNGIGFFGLLILILAKLSMFTKNKMNGTFELSNLSNAILLNNISKEQNVWPSRT